MKAAKSIFTKLFIAMIIAGLAVNLLVGAFFKFIFMPRNRSVLINNTKIYTDYIVRDIGIPPDLKRAAAVAGRTGFCISVSGKGLSWSSAESPRALSRSHEVHRLADGSIRWGRGRFLYQKQYGPYRYLFSTRHNLPGEAEELHVILLIAVLSLILGVCFMLIRKILIPVRRLTDGMREVSGGNLDYEVAVRTDDELGQLSRTFNEMRERIRDMLRSREQLLLDVSHELRSPLTRIKVALEYLEECGTKRDIAEDIQEMETMVTEILETERLDRNGSALVREEIDLCALLREIVEEMQIPPEGIHVTPGDAVIRGDRRLVGMLFRNILENARKYSESGSEAVSVAVRSDAGSAVIEVRDHGVGIPKEEIPFVFEPFHRADHSRSRKTGGYGLGLSLCRKIAEAHGGVIEIESTPGEGTLVRVVLPR